MLATFGFTTLARAITLNLPLARVPSRIAHIGSHVPAESAALGPIDRIFTFHG